MPLTFAINGKFSAALYGVINIVELICLVGKAFKQLSLIVQLRES